MYHYFLSDDERTQLYNEIWEEPIEIVAKRRKLSVYKLKNCCNKLQIPMPTKGYWIKTQAGKEVQRPNLPKVTGELKRYIHNYIIKYRTDLDELSDTNLIEGSGLNTFTDETKKHIIDRLSNISVKKKLQNPHKLIKEDKEIDKKLPINASGINLSRAYRILDTIIKTIEDFEGYARIEQREGTDVARFNLLRKVDFYFTITEKHIVSKKLQNDKLVLTMNPKCFIYRDTKIEAMIYEDKDNNPLEDQISEIVYNMILTAERIVVQDIIRDRKYERERLERKRAANLEKIRQGQLEEIKLLDQACKDWEHAERLRKFINAFEKKISDVEDNEEKDRYIKWINHSKDIADWIDPLVEKEDKVLGKGKTIFEEIDINQG